MFQLHQSGQAGLCCSNKQPHNLSSPMQQKLITHWCLWSIVGQPRALLHVILVTQADGTASLESCQSLWH